MKNYFKIGELSKLYGISVDSLRYYEKIGLLRPERGESGYRYYSIRDIWKLNSIRDLRDLGFSMEQIRQYLDHHSTGSTLALLEQEQQTIDERIRELQNLRQNVSRRMEAIRSAQSLETDRIMEVSYPRRQCYTIPEGYTDEREMDVLMRRLQNMDREHLYLIGSHQLGTAISLSEARATGDILYRGVFVIDQGGKDVLPEGNYLTVTYRGDYEKSRLWAGRLLQYADRRGIRLEGDLLEILLVDIHTSQNVQEQITQLQVRVEKN